MANKDVVALEWVNLIKEIIRDEMAHMDATILCQIVEENEDGTFNVTVVPDNNIIVTNVKNIGPDELSNGDFVYVYKFKNQLNNSIILSKTGQGKIKKITSVATEGDTSPISSGGVYEALQDLPKYTKLYRHSIEYGWGSQIHKEFSFVSTSPAAATTFTDIVSQQIIACNWWLELSEAPIMPHNFSKLIAVGRDAAAGEGDVYIMYIKAGQTTITLDTVGSTDFCNDTVKPLF